MKYESFGIAKRLAERQDDRTKKQVGRKGVAKQVALPASVDDVLLLNTMEHLHSRGGAFGMITMPLRADGEIQLSVATVEDALHGEAVVELEADNPDVQELSGKRKRLSDLAAEVSQAESRAHVREDIRDEVALPQCCFRVMKGNPTRGKSISTFIHHGGPILQSTDFAVTLHNALPGGGAAELCVDLCPRVVASCSSSRALIVQDFHPGHSLQTLVETVKGWSASSGSRANPWFHVPTDGLDSMGINDALVHLLERRAVFGSDISIDVDVQTEPWAQLLQHEYLCIFDGSGPAYASDAVSLTTLKVQLSQLGMASLTSGVCYRVSQSVFAPRTTLPLEDLTPFELGMVLKERGWEWQAMPRLVKDRQALTHDTDQATATWYTLGKTILPAYARCLLSCTQLRERYGLTSIPHWVKRPLKDYELLLQGKPIPASEPVRRQALQDFQPEFPDELAIENQEPAANESEEEEAPPIEGWLEDIMEMEEIVCGNQPPEPAPDVDDVPDPPPPLEDPDVDHRPSKRVRGKRRGELETIEWGCFEIARKRVDGLESAFECRCKLHRLNETTDCKRTIGFTEESESHVLCVAKWWCNQALFHRKQYDHRTCFNSIWEVPHYPEDILVAGMITQAPTGYIKTDEEIDAEDRAQRAQGRARGSGGGKGRGRRGPGRGGGEGRGRGSRRGKDNRSKGRSNKHKKRDDDKD